jgi:superfamily II DNA or RNA helicase
MPHPNDLVVARGIVWRVIGIERGDDCLAVRLTRLHPPPSGQQRTLLEPFDRIRLVDGERRYSVVTREQARHAILNSIWNDFEWRETASAAETNAELLPWQLVVSMILLSGRARRVLVADAVGLGKTIQAGFLIRETLVRWPESHVLALVPAGLRAQWAAELMTHFELDAQIVDLAWIDAQSRILPPNVNPWTQPRLVISSLDFAKRTEVIAGPDAVVWDLVVVDEAHTLNAGTVREELARTLCRRARRVVLLTATPHDGTGSRFESLCRIGAVPGEPPIAIVRRERHHLLRTAAKAAAPVSRSGRIARSCRDIRRWRVLRVRPSVDEAHVISLLDRYLARLRQSSAAHDTGAVALLTPVLRKRAASSAHALCRTLERRRALLAGQGRMPSQPSLSFAEPPSAGDDDESDDVLGLRGLENERAEHAWLGAIIEAGRRASGREAKLRVLRRWLTRVSEPVLVFTEYRDTLTHLARALGERLHVEVLHGLSSQDERERAVASFTGGHARILLATDAASEGLNLHRRCRVAIMYDLPWTPLRIEQRVGRLDRIGQRKHVHAIGLASRHGFDAELVHRLEARRHLIARALEDGVRSGDTAWGADAEAAAARLICRRVLLSSGCSARIDAAGSHRRGPSVVAVPPPRSVGGWSGVIAVIVARLADDAMSIDCTCIGVHLAIAVPMLRSRASIRAFVKEHLHGLEETLVTAARNHGQKRWKRSAADWNAFRAISETAESRALKEDAHTRGRFVQPSLFGRYAVPRVTGTGALTASDSLAKPCLSEPALESTVEIALLVLRPGPGAAPG